MSGTVCGRPLTERVAFLASPMLINPFPPPPPPLSLSTVQLETFIPPLFEISSRKSKCDSFIQRPINATRREAGLVFLSGKGITGGYYLLDPVEARERVLRGSIWIPLDLSDLCGNGEGGDLINLYYVNYTLFIDSIIVIKLFRHCSVPRYFSRNDKFELVARRSRFFGKRHI